MNFILAFSLLACILNLIKDLIKGFNDNKMDVYLDICFVFATLIPCLFNLVYFCRRNCNHAKIAKINFLKFIKMDSFDEFYRNKCEKGEWYFCGNSVDDSTAIGKSRILTTEKTLELYEIKYAVDELKLEECAKDLFEEITVCFRILKNTKNFESFFNLFNELPESLREDCYEHYTIKIQGIYVRIFNESNQVYHFNLDRNTYPKINFLSELNAELGESYITEYNKLAVICTGKNITLKHKEGRSDGFIMDHGLNFENLIYMLALFKTCKNEDILICSNNFKSKNVGWMGHIMSCQEIVECFKKEKVKNWFIYDLDSKLSVFFEDSSLVSTGDNGSNGTDKVGNGHQFGLSKNILEVVKNELNLNQIVQRKLPSMINKFGLELGSFLTDFTINYFPTLNVGALDFLINRTSCWRYRSISTNWMSKRFLCDVNYILEAAGAVTFSHKDKRIKPTKKVQDLKLKIPLCTKLMEVKKVKYDLNEECERLKQSTISCNKGSKRMINKKISLIKSHSENPTKFNDFEVKAKLKKNLRNFVAEEFAKIEDNSERIKQNEKKSPDYSYKDALLKKIYTERSGPSLNKVLDKMCEIKLESLKERNIKNLKVISENLSKSIVECEKARTFDEKRYGKGEEIGGKAFSSQVKVPKLKLTTGVFVDLNYKVCELPLKNYYSKLENYIDDFDTEKDQKTGLNDEDVKNLTRNFYNANLGFGKNLWNINKVLNFNCNDSLMNNEKFRKYKNSPNTIIGLEGEVVESGILRILSMIPKSKEVIAPIAKTYKKRTSPDVFRLMLLDKRERKLEKYKRNLLKRDKNQTKKRKRSEEEVCISGNNNTFLKKAKTAKKFSRVETKKLKRLLRKSKNLAAHLKTKERLEKELAVLNESILREKEKIEKKRASDSKSSFERQMKPCEETTNLLNLKLDKQQNFKNQEYWTVRTIRGKVYLREYMSYSEEEKQAEVDKKVSLTITKDLSYPLVYKGKYYESLFIKNRCNNISFFKNKQHLIDGLNKDLIYKVEISD